MGFHEGVANHFSLAVSDSGTKFLMNPGLRHFSRLKATDLMLLDASDPKTMEQSNAPDPTAWGLHGALHRHCPHIRCALHAHPTYATVLASLANSNMLPINQTTARFYNRVVIDEHYGGLALEEEGERCVKLFSDVKTMIMLMGNHGVLAVGDSIASAFDRLYYYERSAELLVKSYMTGQELRILSDEVAEKTARETAEYSGLADRHFLELKGILDVEEPEYCE
jgi:ribulose-5-phosphate 4-epimerase/fuculose-1-phosphate aldolase